MTRILFVSFTSDLGGPVNCLLKLVKYLKHHYQVSVVAPGNGKLFDVLEEMGITGYRTDSYGLTKRNIPWLCQLIRKHKFDLIYGSNYSSGPRNALIAAKLTNRPFIWHSQEIAPRDKARWNAFCLRFADVLIATSQASAQSVRYHVPHREVHVVYNGVDLEDFKVDRSKARRQVRKWLDVPPEEVVVANIGIVCARKGQAHGVDVATEILKANLRNTFVFLGDMKTEPAYAHSLLTKVSQLNLENKIRFPGFYDNIPHFLVGADVLMHTAAWDPHPRVVLEAMGAGLPVAAFAVDGVKEQVVDGETGFLVPYGDIEGLVEALKVCLNNEALRRRLGEAGRQRVRTMFTAEETAQRVSKIIDDILGKQTTLRPEPI